MQRIDLAALRYMQYRPRSLSSYRVTFSFVRFIIFFFFYFLFIFSAFVRDGGTTSKRSNIEHRKLVCVLMPRADRYMSGDVGEVCVRRPRSRCGTYKASVNIVHSLSVEAV